jgi:hypothetical protein
MKIIFIGVNQRYISATNSLLPSVLQKISQVYFYGPGFVGVEVLNEGINNYVDRLGGVDFIFITAQCIIDIDIKRLDNYFTRYTAVLNGGRISQIFLNDVKDFCKSNKEKVICTISEVDPHVTQQSTIDNIDEHAQYLMGWGNGFLDTKSDLEAIAGEPYIQNKLKQGYTLGLLDQFVNDFSSRVINLGHFVNDSEFYWGDFSSRKYDVSVPGSAYRRRIQAMSAIKRVGYIKIAWNNYKYFFKIADRFRLKPYANFYLVNLYNLFFQQELSQSKACICDGGGNNYPVRKFFEIPASGALMICWPAVGLEKMGFVDGENCIFIKNVEDIIDVLKLMSKSPDDFQSIAYAGRSLVLQKHSLSARAIQLRGVLQKIQAGNYNGSIWHAGEFKFFNTE